MNQSSAFEKFILIKISHRMTKIKLLLLIMTSLVVCSLSTFAQVTVSGKVSDNQVPLVGAAVVEKGTNNGVTTDIDGNFSLNVKSKNSILTFSFIGFKTQEIAVGNRTAFNVTLEDADALNEVVVVGYGTQKKAVTTGAISKVKASDLESMPVMRVEESLRGRTSGVTVVGGSGQPGDGATVRIRGITSINNSEPLYVVDGVPIDGGGISYLSQSDIESIEVLKDAASAAIYGARSANGVILVTTKKGNKDGNISVNYNAYMGVQNPWRKLSLLNAREYGILMNESSVAAGSKILFNNPESLGTGTDWQDAVFYKNAPIQNHELSIAAGSQRSQYYVSFGYYDQQGIIAGPQSRFQRISVRFNSTHKINDYINFGNTLGYSKNLGKGVPTNTEYGSPLGRAINLDPLTKVIETDPSVLSSSIFTNFPVVRDDNGQPYGISPYVTSEVLNPLAAIRVAQGSGWGDKLAGNVFVEIEPLKGLKARTDLGADLAYWGDESFSPIYYLNAANRSDFTRYARAQYRGIFLVWNNSLSYSKKIGEHNLTALIGTAAERGVGGGQGGNVQGIPVTDIKEASLNFFVPQSKQGFFGYEYQSRLLSYFGRVNYDFGGKYLFSGLIRRDGSPKFGPNYRFGNFPSVSVGWVLTEEKFLKKNSIVNFLKMRGSWGLTGNDRIGDFRYVSTVGGGRNYTFGTSEKFTNGVSPNASSNPDLRWEETTQTNIGFDAKLFKNWSLTIDWFNKTTDGMLLDIAVPGYVGNLGPVGNVASMENKGLELELGFTKKVKQVNISLSGNVSFVENKIISLGSEKKYLTGQTFSPQGLEITRTVVGQPFGAFFGYRVAGIFQNQAEVEAYKSKDGGKMQPEAKAGDFKFEDTNGDGKLDADDRSILGDPTPNVTYGFNFSANFQGFDVVIFGQGVAGNQVFKATRRFDLQMANLTSDALGRWTGEGSSTTYPRLVMNDPNKNFSRSSNFYIEDGSYFRVRTLQVGYTLPLSIASKMGLKRLRAYVSGNNLLTLTKYSGFDPEIGGGSFGIDRGLYPQARSYMVGLNVGF